MKTFRAVLGHRFDENLQKSLLQHEDAGRVIRLQVPEKELGRRRFKAADQHGVEYGVALSREVRLENGAVLELTPERAVVVEAWESEQLELRAVDAEGGVQLGWHAGHLHWRIRTSGDRMTVLLDAPREEYLKRISGCVEQGLIEVVE